MATLHALVCLPFRCEGDPALPIRRHFWRRKHFPVDPDQNVRQTAVDGLPILQTYASPQDGQSSGLWAMTQDRAGRIYVGCDSVLSFDGEQWSPHAMGFSYAVRGLDFGSDGRLWAGAIGELGWFDPAQNGIGAFHSLRTFLPFPAADLGEVWNVFADGDGAVFITTNRVLRWDGTKFQTWDFPELGSRRLVGFRSQGKIYVSHRTRGLFRLDENGPKLELDTLALGITGIVFAKPNGDGGLTLVAPQGLKRWKNGVLSSAGGDPFLHDHIVSGGVSLKDGSLAIATLLGGIVIFNQDGSLRRIYDARDGLPTKEIYSLFVDRDGSLWATTATGVFRLDLSRNQSVFDERTGLASAGVRDLSVHEGKLVVASVDDVWELEAGAPASAHFVALSLHGQPILSLADTADGLLIGRSTKIEALSRGSSQDASGN